MANQNPLDTVIDRLRTVLEGREGNFQDPTEMFNRIAKAWEAYKGVPFNAFDAAIMIELFKIVRMGVSYKPDHADDQVNYGLLSLVIKELEPSNDTTE